MAIAAIHEDGIPAKVPEAAIRNRAMLRIAQQYRSASIYGPIAAQKRLAVFHERAGSHLERKAFERKMLRACPGRAYDLDEMRQMSASRFRGQQICAWIGKTYKRPALSS